MSSNSHLHVCEGCRLEVRGGQMIPDGWMQFGASVARLPDRRIASWCPACVENRTMDREALTPPQARRRWRDILNSHP
jgi:hypothetical protein